MNDTSVNKPTDSPTYLLTIDNGTQSVRVMLFSPTGELLLKSKRELNAYFSSAPGLAEQHATYYWKEISLACKGLWEMMQQHNMQRSHICAVSLTTQRDTMICLDKHNQPLRPALLWLDQRTASNVAPMPWYWNAAFSLVSQKNTVNYFRQKAKANWLAENEPELWEQTEKFVLLSAYLHHRLSGKFIDSSANTVGYLPFDYKTHQWANHRDWKWKALAIKASQLPELVSPGTTLGHIQSQASKDTGIPINLPIIASASDKACEVLGSGCIHPHQGSLSYGTTATFNTNNTRYIEPSAFVPPYPSALPNQYNIEAMIYRGFWMVNWFKHEFGLREVQQAEALGVPPESLFDALVNQIPPGSEGLFLQPFWSPSLKNLEAKGAIIGFSDNHTRAHIYRAMLEGLAYALREGKESIEKRQKQAVTVLRVSGGGSQSDAAMQLTADIFNLPAERPHTYETSGLGAAINAAVGVNIHQSYTQAIQQMTRSTQVFKPNPDHADRYHALYQHVYLPMYKQLKPLYKTIQRITE